MYIFASGPSCSFLCCLSIWFFCYDSYVPIFFLQKGFASLTSGWWYEVVHSSPTCWQNLFRCFGMSCFICIVWSCLCIFLVFLFSPVHSDLFPQVVSFVLILQLFFSSLKIFLRFGTVIAFLIVFVRNKLFLLDRNTYK